MTLRNYPGLSEQQRKEIAEALTRVMADTYLLYFKTHAFHWNVEGPRFYGLHNLFEEQYREMWEALDVLAERIRALGLAAPMNSGQLARAASISEQDKTPSADDMVRELTEGHESVMGTIHSALPVAQDAKDEATVGILANRLEAHEKAAWMLSTLAA